MNMDRLRRLRAYFMAATRTLEQIPAPVPPSPAKSWEGPTIDTRELYLTYNRLPADLQKQAAKSHYVCEQVLEWQRATADRVLMARAMLMKDMVEGLELAPHMEAMVDLPAVQAYRTQVDAEAGDGDDVEGADEDTFEAVQRDVEQYLRAQLAARDQAMAASRAQDEDTGEGAGEAEVVAVAPEAATPDETAEVAAATAVELPEPTARGASQRMVRAWAVSATVVAAVCAGLLILHHMAVPAPAPAAIRPINQLVQTGDLTAIVSYAEHNEDATDVHVHVINAGSEPAPADLSLGEADRDPPAGPTLIPARSAQHRVLRVRKDRDRTKAVKLLIHDEEFVISHEL